MPSKTDVKARNTRVVELTFCSKETLLIQQALLSLTWLQGIFKEKFWKALPWKGQRATAFQSMEKFVNIPVKTSLINKRGLIVQHHKSKIFEGDYFEVFEAYFFDL